MTTNFLTCLSYDNLPNLNLGIFIGISSKIVRIKSDLTLEMTHGFMFTHQGSKVLENKLYFWDVLYTMDEKEFR